MYFIEKDGQRKAVFDRLVDSETGRPVEISVSSPEMEVSMLHAEALGLRGLEGILDPKNPEALSTLERLAAG